MIVRASTKRSNYFYEQQITWKWIYAADPFGKKIFVYSVPLMFTNILQDFVNMSDVAVVGKFAGAIALGAVGSTSILVTLFTGIYLALLAV